MRNVEEDNEEEEEYIDMEVSFSSITKTTTSTNSQTKEFEFQMTKPISQDKENYSKSPADELFYKGNLLPLHLPPRLEMVQKLLQNSTTSTLLSTTTTPLESCNISPSESRRVSSELNPDEYFFEWSTELRGLIGDNSRKCWSKKLKIIKQSSLCQKLKAFFNKKGCSDSKAMMTCNNDKYKDVMKKHPTIANVIRGIDNDDGVSHRRSFSGAIKRRYAAVCSSSSSSNISSASSSSSVSFNSSGFYELKFLKRSSSANSEIEAAIAHCKKSQDQNLYYSRNTLNPNETGKLMFSS